MNNVMRVLAVILSAGMLGASACSSCAETSTTDADSTSTQTSYTCGANTHLEGSQCVGDK